MVAVVVVMIAIKSRVFMKGMRRTRRTRRTRRRRRRERSVPVGVVLVEVWMIHGVCVSLGAKSVYKFLPLFLDVQMACCFPF